MFKPACENCGVGSTHLLCEDCLRILKADALCIHCGQRFAGQGLRCLTCQGRSWSWSELHSSFIFSGGVQRWILDIKENARPERWRELKREWIPQFASHPEAIAFVPSDPISFRRRLFDPGEALAKYLSRSFQIPVVNAFKREEFLRSQKTLRRQDRLRYFGETLKLRPLTQRFRCLLLVDDVMTSGASLLHCSELLKGVSDHLVVYCVARTLATKPLI